MDLVTLDKLTYLDLRGPLEALLNQADHWFAPGAMATSSTACAAINFNQAYQELGAAVRRIGIYRGRMHPNDADDFLHEVFRRVWERRSGFRGESTANAWIIGIAFNVARNEAKRFKPPMDRDRDCDTLPYTGRLSPEERAMQGEAEAQIALAVARLTEYEQHLFITSEATGNITETAVICQVSYSKAAYDLIAVKAKLAKILAQLQRDNGWKKR